MDSRAPPCGNGVGGKEKVNSTIEERAAMELRHDLWRDSNGGETVFLAADPRMLQIKSLAERVAKTRAPVLIMGES